jgi:hypothetical protein
MNLMSPTTPSPPPHKREKDFFRGITSIIPQLDGDLFFQSSASVFAVIAALTNSIAIYASTTSPLSKPSPSLPSSTLSPPSFFFSS